MDSKAIRVALVVVIVFSLSVATTLPASASATADNFGVEDASGFKNTNVLVLVPVNITNVHSESIVGVEFEFLYNSNAINLAEIQKGTLTSQWSDHDKKGIEG